MLLEYLFLEGIRVVMLRNWRFDIFNAAHWNYAWENGTTDGLSTIRKNGRLCSSFLRSFRCG